MLVLPDLDEDCANCTGYAAVREANRVAVEAWEAEKAASLDAYVAAHPDSWAPLRWTCTDEHQAMLARAPEELPERGCPACRWTGRQPTAAGRQVLDFLNK